MDWHQYIIADENILLGKPIIKGTRISVEFILERLADGWTDNDILQNYPQLTTEHLQAIFSYIHDCFKDGLLVA